jgi:hypothetical protein
MLLAFAIAAFLPRVEDPWPDEIGVLFPFTVAGLGGTIAQFALGSATAERRDQAIQRWGRRGMYLGSAFYLAALVAQVVSLP